MSLKTTITSALSTAPEDLSSATVSTTPFGFHGQFVRDRTDS